MLNVCEYGIIGTSPTVFGHTGIWPEGEVVQLPRGYREMERTRNGKKDSQEPWRSEPEDFRRHSFVKPPKFDGKGCVESHLLQFKIAASRNQWTSSEKADFLKISLTGEASAVLKDMEEDITFEELSDKLKQCFGTLEQQEVFKIQLKARRRRKGESLSELMKDVRRLFLQAYPGQMNVLSLAIAKDAFIDALEDKELMIRVMEREPKSLEEAFKIAERMELYSRKVNAENGAESEGKMRNTSHKVRSTSSTDEDTIKTLLENQKTIQRQMSELMHQMQVSNSSANKERKSRSPAEETKETRTVRCYECGQEGHVRSKCPYRKNVRSEMQSKGHNRVACYNCGREGHISANCSEKGNKDREGEPMRMTDKNGKKSREEEQNAVRKIGSTLYARMEVNGKSVDCLIDTGSEVNLMPAEMLDANEIQPTSRKLQAANGTRIGVLGEVELLVQVANICLPTKFVVSDQIDETLIGVDWLQTNGCYISFPENIMTIQGNRVPLLKKIIRDRCNRVVLQEDITVPASSEMTIPGKIVFHNLSMAKVGDWATCTRECNPGLHVAGAVLPNRSMDLPVRVLNVCQEDQVLKKGMTLSALEPVILQEGEGDDQGKMDGRPEKINSLIENVVSRVDEEINEKDKIKLRILLQEYEDVISCDELDLGLTDVVEHSIDTGNAKPCRQALRRAPAAYANVVEEQVQLMLKQGIIEPSVSEWSSNVVLVKKKDQTYRFCVDFRNLNALSIRDTQPIPRIDSCLEALAGSSWFSTLDMRSGFFQVKIREEDAKKTNFIVRSGSYNFRVMPMGLCNSTATFQRLMNIVMAGLTYQACLVYLDDVIVFADSVDEHLKRLKEVLQRFRKANLKIRADKCHILQKEVNFLGYRVSQAGVGTQKSKVEAVLNWPIPKNLKEVRSFVGLCSYYRVFVEGFAGITEPLHALTRKGARWNWDGKCQTAFEELKRRLTTAPIMTLPQDDDIYVLDTDASNCHIGAVLSVIRGGQEHVVAYGSRLYSSPEMNYCVTRKELLAIVYFTKLYRHYLLGKRFTIRTDHAALQWLKKTPEPIGQQSRWLEQLEAFDYTVVHREGRKHQNADAMSRIPCSQCKMLDEETSQVRTIVQGDGSNDGEDLWAEDNVKRLQESDVVLGDFYRLKLAYGEEKPGWEEVQVMDETAKTLWNMWSDVVVRNGVLYRKTTDKEKMTESWQMIAPVVLRRKIVELAHKGMTGGHLGLARTKEQVRRRAYWPGWSKLVKTYCDACEPCARYRRGKPPKQGLLQPIGVGMPFEVLSIDITGPHPKSNKGNVYILTAMDQFSKFAFAFPIRNQEAVTVARVLMDQVFSYFGTPLRILSDQGKNFESSLFKELCQRMDIEKVRTSAYKASTNGQLERFHRTLNSMIAKVVRESQRDWDEFLPQLLAAYRASVHSVTGYSPNFLLFGHENRAPIDLVMQNPETVPEGNWSTHEYVARKQEVMLHAYASARDHLRVAAQRRKRTYDIGVKVVEFTPNQKVWYYYPRQYLRRSKKFQFVYTGPYTVVKRLGAVNYLIQKNSKSPTMVVHVDKLKACQEMAEIKTDYRARSVMNNTDDYYIPVNSCCDPIVVTGGENEAGKEVPAKRGPPKQCYDCKICGDKVMGYRAFDSHKRRCLKKMLRLDGPAKVDPLEGSGVPEIETVLGVTDIEQTSEDLSILKDVEIEMILSVTDIEQTSEDLSILKDVEMVFAPNMVIGGADTVTVPAHVGFVSSESLSGEAPGVGTPLYDEEASPMEVLWECQANGRWERRALPNAERTPEDEKSSNAKNRDEVGKKGVEECEKCEKEKRRRQKVEQEADKFVKAGEAVGWIADKLMEEEAGDVEELSVKVKSRFVHAGPLTHIKTLVMGVREGLRRGEQKARIECQLEAEKEARARQEVSENVQVQTDVTVQDLLKMERRSYEVILSERRKSKKKAIAEEKSMSTAACEIVMLDSGEDEESGLANEIAAVMAQKDESKEALEELPEAEGLVIMVEDVDDWDMINEVITFSVDTVEEGNYEVVSEAPGFDKVSGAAGVAKGDLELELEKDGKPRSEGRQKVGGVEIGEAAQSIMNKAMRRDKW